MKRIKTKRIKQSWIRDDARADPSMKIEQLEISFFLKLE